MGRNHAVFGAVICLGIGRTMGISPQLLVASTICVSGAALLPDIDEQGSTVAHLFDPISGAIAHITNKLAGGHRVGTHSLVGLCISGAALWALTKVEFGDSALFVPGLVLSICSTLVIRSTLPAFIRPSKSASLVVAIGVSYGIYKTVGFSFVPFAVSLGWGTHLLGDMLTTGGVPLLWPFSKNHFDLAILKCTNSIRERVFGLFLTFVTVLLGWQEVALTLTNISVHLRPSSFF